MVMVYIALSATALLLAAAFAIDVGLVWTARNQSQNADDSAALAAAANMIDTSSRPATVTLGTARTSAQTYAGFNSTVANPSVTVRDQDIVFGNWNLQTRTLDTSVDLTDPDEVTAVQVTVLMDDNVNENSPAVMARVGGIDGFDVTNRAIGYLGFEGSFGAGEFELPIVLDSCNLSSDNGCGDDFCELSETPDNPCPLLDPQVGDGDVTCLEFSSTPEQNACWTVFNGDHPSINNPDLQDVADDGNAGDIEAGDEVFLDNGDKNNTLHYIRDMFYGNNAHGYNGPRMGVDRYEPFEAPPKSDSWVVKLPVVECQDTANCAGGDPFAITGGVCFEIREVNSPPHEPGDRLIKGRFLCPDSPDPVVRQLFEDHCADDAGDPPDDPGGCNFGFRADRVVLVQ